MAYASISFSFGEQPSAAKWNILGTNDAYFDSLIGSGTAWTTWVPGFTNFTLGNGTINVAKYQQLGKQVFGRFLVTLGSTSSVSGSIIVGMPVTSASTYTTLVDSIGEGIIRDTGTILYRGTMIWVTTTTMAIYRNTNTANNISVETVSASSPMVFTTSDSFGGWFRYEAA